MVLGDLDELVTRRLGENHPLVLRLVTAQADLEADQGKAGDARLRERAGRAALTVSDRLGQPRDAVAARTHLGAITGGGPCGCGTSGEALAVALREYVRGRLPADLLKELDVTYAGDDFDVKVRLMRPPTGEEQQELYDVINAGLD